MLTLCNLTHKLTMKVKETLAIIVNKEALVGGTNINWDASWEVKTQRGDYGWSAEFAIPLKSLRFGAGKNKTWGVNFQRNIAKIVSRLLGFTPIRI